MLILMRLKYPIARDILKLYGSDVRVLTDRDRDIIPDLQQIGDSKGIEKELKRRFADPERTLVLDTIGYLLEHNPEVISNKTYYAGARSIGDLDTKDYYHFFKRLLKPYWRYRRTADEFLLKLEQAEADLHSKEVPKRYNTRDNRTKWVAFLRSTVEDLTAIDEPVNYFRLKALRDYIPAMVEIRDTNREEIIGKILHNDYPFRGFDKDNWVETILSFCEIPRRA